MAKFPCCRQNGTRVRKQRGARWKQRTCLSSTSTERLLLFAFTLFCVSLFATGNTTTAEGSAASVEWFNTTMFCFCQVSKVRRGEPTENRHHLPGVVLLLVENFRLHDTLAVLVLLIGCGETLWIGRFVLEQRTAHQLSCQWEDSTLITPSIPSENCCRASRNFASVVSGVLRRTWCHKSKSFWQKSSFGCFWLLGQNPDLM